MAQQPTADDDSIESVTVTFSVEKAMFALKMNDTNGADDRTIAAPQRDGAPAVIRRKFTGTERYSNPETAPVHLSPERLVDKGFEQPPRQSQTADAIPEIPPIEQRTEEDEKLLEEEHDVAVEHWETDVARMLAGEHEIGRVKNVDLTLVGVEQ
jgi:hypothetical protein